jgi:acetamidase/formamidase
VRIDAAANTTHWGFLDGRLKPLLRIESGDVVTISTVSGGPDVMPPPPLQIPQALRDIHQKHQGQTIFGHICTGPVAIAGAKPGQVLQVDIEDIGLAYDWGYTTIRPLRGTLPYGVHEQRTIHPLVDAKTMTGRLPWGLDIGLRPFFGVMAVAPPLGWGRISTIPPRWNGGNMDNKELVAGTTLYLPIFVEEALFSAGDGHAVQGDGEVCVTAIETGLVGRFRLTLRDDLRLTWPLAETPTHVITMGFDPDLDDCVVIALRQMIEVLKQRARLSADHAYMLCSLAADLRITQVVNDTKGVHVMLDKQMFGESRGPVLEDLDLAKLDAR